MYSTEDKNRFKPHLVEIEDEPVSPLGRKILWAIILFMVIAVAWLFLGKTDVVVSARSEVVPVGNVKMIQSLGTGVIQKIYVKTGDSVKKGAPLIEIDPTVEKSDLASKEHNAQILSLEIQKLKATIEDRPFHASADTDPMIATMISGMSESEKASIASQQQQIDQQIRQIQNEIRSTQIDIDGERRLLRMGREQEMRMRKVLDIIAKNDYYRLQKENRQYQNDISVKQERIMELQSKIAELRTQRGSIVKDYKSRLYQSLSQKMRELSALRSEISAVKFREKKQLITAPMDGIVAKLEVNTVGGVVTPAQKLMTLIPKDAPMQVKAIVENKDIGFIKKGMEAVIKIDTFDYQKYGFFKAKVEKISPNAIEDKKLGLVYEVYVTPTTKYLEVEGEKRYLLPGMSATTEIKVGRRRIIEFFVYPLIKYYKEGISVR